MAVVRYRGNVCFCSKSRLSCDRGWVPGVSVKMRQSAAPTDREAFVVSMRGLYRARLGGTSTPCRSPVPAMRFVTLFRPSNGCCGAIELLVLPQQGPLQEGALQYMQCRQPAVYLRWVSRLVCSTGFPCTSTVPSTEGTEQNNPIVVRDILSAAAAALALFSRSVWRHLFLSQSRPATRSSTSRSRSARMCCREWRMTLGRPKSASSMPACRIPSLYPSQSRTRR